MSSFAYQPEPNIIKFSRLRFILYLLRFQYTFPNLYKYYIIFYATSYINNIVISKTRNYLNKYYNVMYSIVYTL